MNFPSHSTWSLFVGARLISFFEYSFIDMVWVWSKFGWNLCHAVYALNTARFGTLQENEQCARVFVDSAKILAHFVRCLLSYTVYFKRDINFRELSISCLFRNPQL